MRTPKGWKLVPLNQVAEVRSGLAKNSKRQEKTKRLPYLRVANVQDGVLDLKEIKEIDVPEKQISRFSLQPGDYLLVEGNGNPENLGRGALWNGQIPDMIHQNHIFAVRIIDQFTISPIFLGFQMQSDQTREYFLSCAKSSSGLATLNSQQLRDCPVLVPPKEEQDRISSVLAEWDAAIEKTEQLIEAHQKRLHYSRNALLLNPGNSQQVRLRDVTSEATARNNHRLGRESIMAVTKQAGLRPMREETISNVIERYKLVRPGAFAYNPMRLNIGSIAMSELNEEVLVSPDYVVFECDKNKILPGYLNHLRCSPLWTRFFEAAGSGSVRVRIYYADLSEFKFKLPTLPIQKRVTEFLDSAAEEIATLSELAAVLVQQKRGLMQKLLTGRWRLPADLPEAPR